MDLFTVEVLTLGGLVPYSVLFVIDVATRRVHIAGIAREPDGRWMLQVARNLTDPIDGVLPIEVTSVLGGLHVDYRRAA